MNSKFEINFTTKRLTLSAKQALMHYYIVVLPILLFLLNQFANTETFKHILLLGCLITSIVFGFIQWRLLYFKEFKVDCKHNDLVEAFKRSAQSLDWKIESTSEILCAFDKEHWDFRYNSGYVILISKTDNGFLFNSLSDPRKMTAPLINPLYNLNKNVFIKHLIDTIAGKEYNEEFESLNRKWGLRNIVIRLILYPLSLGLILLSIYSLTQGTKEGIFYLIISSVISIIYLTSDIKSLIK